VRRRQQPEVQNRGGMEMLLARSGIDERHEHVLPTRVQALQILQVGSDERNRPSSSRSTVRFVMSGRACSPARRQPRSTV
jgi:hypothetical protein